MSSRNPDGRLRRLLSCSRVFLLLSVLPVGLAHALPDDGDQPIHITADKALRDEKQGYTQYSGNVQMSQGSMALEADTLTIYHVSEDADKIVAEGNPAKMRQQPELDKGLVHAQAGIIEYFKDEERVHLQTDARIERDGDLVIGDSIDYFIVEQLVRADSDQTLEGNRVQVVIQPTVQQEKTDTPATAPPGEEAPSAGANEQPDTPPGTTPTPQETPVASEQQEENGSGPTESE